jgi:UPF0755 protein
VIGSRIVTAVALVLALAVIVAFAWFVYMTPGAIADGDLPAIHTLEPATGDPLLITIEPGESARSIGKVLEEQGIIESGRHFEVLVGLTGVQDSLEAGEYEFERGIPVLEAVNRIAEGRTASRHVVIPEGLRAEEIGQILEDAEIVSRDAFMTALVKAQYDEPFLAQVQSDSLEGFLFPAAYEFRRDVTPREVVDTMLLAFQTNVADQIQLEGQDLRLEEVVSLAAIVEREATVVSEHPIIASVFLNRLRSGIPLQADPTVQFAISSDPASVAEYGWWKEELTVDDLAFDSLYNTYVYAGLPPGPIANPGLDTVQSVIRPAQTQYLYFVARGDGSHVFAETLEEHLANVELYQR